jgi:predicted RNA-binding Zn ribbon-like protein
VVERFRQGSGRICLDFIRTLRRRDSDSAVEELPDAAALGAWLRQCGPVTPARVTAGDVAAAHRLREAVFALIAAGRGAGVRTCDPAALELVNQVAAGPVPAPLLDAAGTVSWLAVRPVSATLALIARDAVDLVASPAIDRVRECASHDCQALFLDSSRPASRRWCSMDVCGNRAKKEAIRARQA